jgi:hypothetical protein
MMVLAGQFKPNKNAMLRHAQMYIPQVPFTTHTDPMLPEEAFSATTTPSKLPDRMASK